jgi:hypothetical protein
LKLPPPLRAPECRKECIKSCSKTRAKFCCQMRAVLSLQKMDVNRGLRQVIHLGEGGCCWELGGWWETSVSE